MNSEFQAFIFDMDGTILSTNEDICDSVNHALETYHLPTIGYSECEGYLGNGSVKLIQRAMKGQHTELFQQVFDCYYQYYLKHFDIKSRPYDGIVDSLKFCKEMGILFFIYTNKPERIAQEIVDKVFPKGMFSKTVGVPLGGKTKPEPEAFLNQTKDWNLDYSKVAYFGDSVTDIQTAHNLHVHTICSVLWGFQDEKRLKGYPIHPDFFLEKPEDIKRIATLKL
jgi:phosphoglycolate phosphatase